MILYPHSSTMGVLALNSQRYWCKSNCRAYIALHQVCFWFSFVYIVSIISFCTDYNEKKTFWCELALFCKRKTQRQVKYKSWINPGMWRTTYSLAPHLRLRQNYFLGYIIIIIGNGIVLNMEHMMELIVFYCLELILNGTFNWFVELSQLLITETNCMNIILFYYRGHIWLVVSLLLW